MDTTQRLRNVDFRNSIYLSLPKNKDFIVSEIHRYCINTQSSFA